MKLGLWGTGQISEQLMRNAKKIPEIQVVSVMHREIHKAKKFASDYGISSSYDQVDDFLKSDMDAVYVGLPNSLHFEAAEKCIRAGKHVLVEKPFTSNMHELDALIRLSEKHDAMILEVNRVVYLPNTEWIRQRLSCVGKIKHVSISYCKRSRKYDDYLANKRPNVFTAEYSGGALMDLGVYGLHLVCELFEIPERFSYKCQKLKTGVDAEGLITLDYGSWSACIQISKVTNGASSVKIQGEQADVVFEYAPSILKEGTVTDEACTVISSIHVEDNFYYFLKKACLIIDSNDREETNRLMEKSIQVMKLMDGLRKQCGIVFSADMEDH